MSVIYTSEGGRFLYQYKLKGKPKLHALYYDNKDSFDEALAWLDKHKVTDWTHQEAVVLDDDSIYYIDLELDVGEE